MVRVLLAVLGCAILFVAPSSPKLVKFTDCGSREGEIVSLDISPCNGDPCNMKQGTVEEGTLTFVPHEDIKRAKLTAFAIIDKLPIPLPIPSDACEGYGLKCPIASGQKSMFVIKQDIEPGFPLVNLTLKGEVIDADTQITVFCFETNLTIVS